MTDNIVTLHPPKPANERAVWACLGCGCMTFYMRVDGMIECAGCDYIGETPDGSWRERLPEPPDEVPLANDTNHIIRSLGSAEIVKNNLAKRIKAQDLVCIALVGRDGHVYTWTEGASNPEQLAWLNDRIDRAREQVTEKTPEYHD